MLAAHRSQGEYEPWPQIFGQLFGPQLKFGFVVDPLRAYFEFEVRLIVQTVAQISQGVVLGGGGTHCDSRNTHRGEPVGAIPCDGAFSEGLSFRVSPMQT